MGKLAIYNWRVPNQSGRSLMRMTLLALFVLAPTLALGQSLAEVAKKEKNRREKNKQEGREAQVISESELGSGSEDAQTESTTEEGGAATSPSYGASSSSSSEQSVPEDESEEEESVPAFIPPDAPLPEKLDMFERMKRQYQRQVQEIEEANAQLRTRKEELKTNLQAKGRAAGIPPGYLRF